jgi:protein-tyrosine phosphatase
MYVYIYLCIHTCMNNICSENEMPAGEEKKDLVIKSSSRCLSNQNLHIFVTYTVYIFETFNQHFLSGQVYNYQFESIVLNGTCKIRRLNKALKYLYKFGRIKFS